LAESIFGVACVVYPLYASEQTLDLFAKSETASLSSGVKAEQNNWITSNKNDRQKPVIFCLFI
jgi:hypothetical protein